MKIEILETAMADLVAGYQFYEEQCTGVGPFFLDTLFSEIDGLTLYAGVHRKFMGYHRLLSKKFPFAIYYRTLGESVRVWRVLDCRRDPVWLRRQLKN